MVWIFRRYRPRRSRRTAGRGIVTTDHTEVHPSGQKSRPPASLVVPEISRTDSRSTRSSWWHFEHVMSAQPDGGARDRVDACRREAGTSGTG